MKRPSLTMTLMATLAALAALHFAGRACAGRYYGNKEPDVEPVAPSDDWQRMEQPKRGEWLAAFPEEGQTFDEYKAEVQNRKTRERSRIYVVPLGRIAEEHPKLIAQSAEYLAIFFDSEVTQLPARFLPTSAYDAKRAQYDAGQLLDAIVLPLARKQQDALAVAGIASEDLYHGDLNFVFGIGSLHNRCGVYSVRRLLDPGEEGEKTTLVRTIKLASHEIGHILGMTHCTFYHCVMNGSNSLPEADARPLFLCPVCARKLEWNLGFDSRKRYERMEAFFKQHGLEEQQSFCRRRIEELKKPGEGKGP